MQLNVQELYIHSAYETDKFISSWSPPPTDTNRKYGATNTT
jgi:hypothetical protein